MAGNYVKTKRHVLTDDGYKVLSQWSNANSVEMDNGNSVQTEVTNLKNTATTAAAGLMSSSDKKKLDTIDTSANNYTHPSYTTAANGLYKVSVDSTGHVSSAVAAVKSDITALGIPAQDTTYAAATGSNAGLMTAAMVNKLASVDTSANNYTHPSYTSYASGLRKFTVDTSGHVSATAAVAKSDITGLGIPAQDTTYAAVTTAANGLMTSADKTKLDSVAASANNYVHPSYTSAASGMYKVTVDENGHVSGVANILKSDITALGIPAQDTNTTYAAFTSAAAGLVPAAKSGTTNYATTGYVLTGAGWAAGTKYNTDTNTTYAAVTTATNGLMTSADKTKLDGIDENANAYTHPSYTSYASGLRKFTVDTSGHVSATAAVAKSDITALGIPAQDTTYTAATTTDNGLMTAADKTKLDGIAEGANNYTHPSYTSYASGLRKFTTDTSGHVSATAAVAKADITALGIPAQDTTYAAFTSATAGLVPAAASGTTSYLTSGYVLTGAGWKAGTKYNTDTNTTYAAVTTAANGLMISSDKAKLDGIAEGANNYTHPSYTSAASGLYKVTVDASGHISATAAVAKADITALGIPGSDTNTTYATFTSAANGLVPAAKNGTTNYATTGYVLTGAGWAAGTKYNTDSNTTYAAVTTAANGLMTSSDKTKLDGIAAGAQVNTITGVKGNAESSYRTGNVNLTPANIGAIPSSEKGASGGVVPLNSSGTIDSTYLPSYVDDVLEYSSKSAFPATGESGKIYVDTSVEENNTYRWSGSTYILIAKNTNTTYTISKSGSTVTLTGSDGSTTSFTDSNTTYSTFTSAANGLVPAAKNGTTNYATTGYVLTGAGWAAGTKYNVDNNTTYAAVTTATNGLMTSADKTKLDGIDENANAYTHPSYTSYASGLRKFTVDASGHVSATAAVAKADITGLGIPAQDTTYANFTSAASGLVPAAASGSTSYLTSGYVLTGAGWKAGTKYNTDTNTTYAAVTTAANGLMIAADKSKLDSIDENANNYTHPSYTSAASGLYKVTVDASGHVSATAAVAKADITALGIPGSDTNTTYANFTSAAAGLVPAAKSGSTNYATTGYVLTGAGWAVGTKYNVDNNTTYAAVTTAANGLMIAADKIKLDSVAASANNYTHPSYTSYASGLRKFTTDTSGHVSATAAVAKSDITGLGIPAQDTTYATFTSAANGLVPAAKNGTTNYATTGYVLTGAGWAAGTKYNTDTNTTYGAVTTAANGLMIAADKVKVDSISGIYPVKGTQTAVTGSWTGEIDAPALYDGMTIAYYLPYNGSGNATLNLTLNDDTTTGPINCYFTNNSRLTTHYGAGSTILLTYWSAGSIKVSGTATTDNRWTHADHNSNTTYNVVTSAANGLAPKLSNNAGQYLNGTGGWTVPTNTTYAVATTAANGLMTAAMVTKLNGIAEGANNYTHPSYTSYASGLRKFTVDASGHVSATAAVTKSDITALGIPGSDTNTTYANYVGATTAASGTAGLVPAATTAQRLLFLRGDATWQTPTNTTYAVATTAANGLMTKDMVIKLNGIAAGANAYTHPSYTSYASGLRKFTVDATGHVSATAAVAKSDITGLGIPAQDTTYAAATTAANGLMTTDMVTKLNGIAAGANAYTHPSYTSAASGLYKISVDASGHVNGATAVAKADITALGIPGSDTNTTYAAFTSAAAGLVPAAKNGTTNYATTGYVLTGAGWQAGTKYNVDNNTTYAVFTSAANGLVPAAKNGTTNYATSGYVLTGAGWQAGTKYNTDTTYGAMGAATTAAAGTAGLVPAPASGAANRYLRSDATWQVPPDNNTTYAVFTSAANGLVPAAKSGSTNYATTGYVLTGAGWAAGTKYNTDTNTTYGAATSAAQGLTKASYVTGTTLVVF